MGSETYTAAEITLVADEVDHAHAICTRKENQTYTEDFVPRRHRMIGWALREAAARAAPHLSPASESADQSATYAAFRDNIAEHFYRVVHGTDGVFISRCGNLKIERNSHCIVLSDSAAKLLLDLLGDAQRAASPQDVQEACAQVAIRLAIREDGYYKDALDDDALSETGKRDVLAAIEARRESAREIATSIRALIPSPAQSSWQPDENYPDCKTDRERELYDALMGLSSAVTARQGCSKWVQGGVQIAPIVHKALRLSDSSVALPDSGGAAS